MEHLFPYPKMGHSWLEILQDQLTRKLLGFDAVHAEKTSFVYGASSRLTFLLQDPTKHLSFLKIGYTALEAFLQANATGPPLDFNPEDSVFPDAYREEIPQLKTELLQSLAVDGNSAYELTPHIELFWLAKLIMSNETLAEAGFNGRRARFRVNFWHQKLLSEKSDVLQASLYNDIAILEGQLASRLAFGGAAAEEHFVEFLMERAVIQIYYGDDEKAREALKRAAVTRHFEFALTGVLGKRTKYQTNDTSQLVVLARSRDFEPEPYSSRKSSRTEGMESRKGSETDSKPGSRNSSLTASGHQVLPHHPHVHHTPDHPHPTHLSPTSPKPHDHERHFSPLSAAPMQPENLPLNDDTLLERIRFKTTPPYEPSLTTICDSSQLPPRLAMLDPADQPLLFPMDSIILLSTAMSITNSSPDDGLTREETLPYATRVLEGGSSNWQVYTQALLVRSRIDGHQSRTVERGLLQLQALVDQVVAETDGSAQTKKANETSAENTSAPTTFLPKPKSSESASVAERLKYIYQLSPPLRWELEAELAARWTSMGGLKTALEIYERLQMRAEVALCLAATGREAEASKVLKDFLFSERHPNGTNENVGTKAEQSISTTTPGALQLRSPPPADSPRLLCILGDITGTPSYYNLAWDISGASYPRAQRSLGRLYMKQRNFPAAAQAYKLALDRSLLDHSTWFSYGCVQLQLENWQGAVESFTRCVQLEDKDVESWSNLAVALINLPPPVDENDNQSKTQLDEQPRAAGDDHAQSLSNKVDPYQHAREALVALRRAAAIKRDSAKIWDNYLTVAASIPPGAGTPWADVIQAMTRVIDIRGNKEGEGAVDVPILKALVAYVTQNWTYPATEDAVAPEGESIAEQVIAEEDEDVEDIAPDEGDDENTGPTDIPKIITDSQKIDEAQPTTSIAAQSADTPAPTRLPYIPRALLSLIDNNVAPLATSSPQIYRLLAQVSLWRARPQESLSYAEKAWRAATTSVDPHAYSSKQGWDEVVDRTIELVEAYKTLGELERERTGGQVESSWKFKARNAVKSVLGRGKDWESTEGWKRLETCRDGLI